MRTPGRTSSRPARRALYGPPGVDLVWSPSTDNVGVTGYHVYSFDGVFISRLVATVTTTSYTAPLLSSRDRYYVRAATNTVPAGTGTATPPSPSSSPVPPQPTCAVTYRTNEWRHGFVANLTISNVAPGVPMTGWTLAFTFGGDQKVISAWSGIFAQTGQTVTITNTSWNGGRPPGGSTTLGLYGSWQTSNAPPTAFTINGIPCTAG